jgi:hypothetical protein
MTSEKSATDKATSAPLVVGAPAVTVEPEAKAGPGQKVVTSPTGTKSVVDDEAVELLKTQGYRVGG